MLCDMELVTPSLHTVQHTLSFSNASMQMLLAFVWSYVGLLVNRSPSLRLGDTQSRHPW